jgi:5-methylcytosine-specific restriction endonuclease McrA
MIDEANLRKRASAANARARKFGLVGRITAEDIAGALRAAGGKCQNPECGRSFGSRYASFREQWVISFQIPLSHGGACSRENLQVICRLCEMRRTHELGVRWT